MKRNKILSWVLALAMVVSMLPVGLIFAGAAELDGSSVPEVKSLADTVREYGFEYFDTINMQGGNSHMQGTCVDDKGEYMYFSYTSALVKMDMKTGEVVGSVGGFGQGSFGTPGGAHLGDLAYYDGKIYGSLEYKEPGSKYFICVFDEDAITEIGMDMKEMDTGVDGILLKEPTMDFRDPLNDSEYIDAYRAEKGLEANGFAINNDTKNGHKFGCSGIDGVAFTNLPGDTSGKQYLFVAYGIYTDNSRFDNNYNVICCYDPEDFDNVPENTWVQRFTYERGVDSSIAPGELLEAVEQYYVWTGHTNWGTQVLETDLDTGDLLMFTYGKGKTVYDEEGNPTVWPGLKLYCIDMDVAAKNKEIEVGQSNTITDPERHAAVIAEAEAYMIDTNGDGTPDAYPKGKHLTLKCICGGNCEPQEWPETGYTSMICGAKTAGTGDYGANSLGDGYWLISNHKYKSELYKLNPENYSFIKVTDLLQDAIDDVAELKERNYSEESWAVLQDAVAEAEALIGTEATPAEKGAAIAAINEAKDALEVTDLASLVLEYGFTAYDTISMCGGNSHMQGTCVDDKGEYMYFSYTSALVKVDMKTGEVVGSVGGFGQGSFGTPGGAHLGDLAYYDGKIYGSLEYKEPGSKFFVCVFDEDAITEIGMDMKEMEVGVDGVLLRDPTEDFRDPLNDSDYIDAYRAEKGLEANGFAINNDTKYGHKYACSGIDGVTFTHLPGDDSGKKYLFVAYGVFTNNDRFDNNYNVICCYDPEDFDNVPENTWVQRFTYERGIDSSVAEGEMLDSLERYFVWTGHTNWGTQVLETDIENGDLILFTYGTGKTVNTENGRITWPGLKLYRVDMSIPAYEAEIEVGQSNTVTDPDRRAAILDEAEAYMIDTDGDGTPDAYPKGMHLTLACVCGNNCEPQEWPETGYTAMICGAKSAGYGDYGANSLGNGYWLISNHKYKSELYRMSDDMKLTKVTNLLEEVIADAETYGPSKYTAPSYRDLEAAIAEAKALNNEPYANNFQIGAAVAGINDAIAGLEKTDIGDDTVVVRPGAIGSVEEEHDCPEKFVDVDEDDWFHEAVDYAVVNKLFAGVTKTTFAPHVAMSRGMMATVLHSMEGKPAAKYDGSFTDVKAGDWYTEAVLWAAGEGIVAGYDNGAFGADDAMTREQLAVMLWRYAGSPEAKAALAADVAAKASDYAEPALAWCVENGILPVKGLTMPDPTAEAARCEVAQMLMNYGKL